MKKEAVVDSGACGQEKLKNNELCRCSGPGEVLVRRREKERKHLLTSELRLS